MTDFPSFGDFQTHHFIAIFTKTERKGWLFLAVFSPEFEKIVFFVTQKESNASAFYPTNAEKVGILGRYSEKEERNGIF